MDAGLSVNFNGSLGRDRAAVGIPQTLGIPGFASENVSTMILSFIVYVLRETN